MTNQVANPFSRVRWPSVISTPEYDGIESGKSHTVLERWNLCFSSYKNCKLKVNPWWVGAHERKNATFFVTFLLSEGNFFNISLLSPSIVYWINFQNKYTFTYQKKHYFIHFWYLQLKLLKVLSASFKNYFYKDHSNVAWEESLKLLSTIYFFTK